MLAHDPTLAYESCSNPIFAHPGYLPQLDIKARMLRECDDDAAAILDSIADDMAANDPDNAERCVWCARAHVSTLGAGRQAQASAWSDAIRSMWGRQVQIQSPRCRDTWFSLPRDRSFPGLRDRDTAVLSILPPSALCSSPDLLLGSRFNVSNALCPSPSYRLQQIRNESDSHIGDFLAKALSLVLQVKVRIHASSFVVLECEMMVGKRIHRFSLRAFLCSAQNLVPASCREKARVFFFPNARHVASIGLSSKLSASCSARLAPAGVHAQQGVSAADGRHAGSSPGADGAPAPQQHAVCACMLQAVCVCVFSAAVTLHTSCVVIMATQLYSMSLLVSASVSWCGVLSPLPTHGRAQSRGAAEQQTCSAYYSDRISAPALAAANSHTSV